MKITDALLGEHGLFYVQFQHLESMEAESNGQNGLGNRIELLSEAIRSHAQAEDEILFPALEPHLGTEAGPLAVMRLEHGEIDDGLGRLEQEDDPATARALLEQLLSLAREHFAKEEHVLFPMAEKLLGSGQLIELGAHWAQRRGVRV